MFSKDQTVFLVPIRYWETQEPTTCRFLGDHRIEGDHPNAATAYVFHDGYGHNVYVHTHDLFPSREDAIDEANKRKAIRDAEFDAQTERILAAILKRSQTP